MHYFPELPLEVPVKAVRPPGNRPWGAYWVWIGAAFLCLALALSIGKGNDDYNSPIKWGPNPDLAWQFGVISVLLCVATSIYSGAIDRRRQPDWIRHDTELEQQKTELNRLIVPDWRPHGPVWHDDGTVKIGHVAGGRLATFAVDAAAIRFTPYHVRGFKIFGKYEPDNPSNPTKFVLKDIAVEMTNPRAIPDLPTFSDGESERILQQFAVPEPIRPPSAETTDSLLRELNRLNLGSPGPDEFNRMAEIFSILVERVPNNTELQAQLQSAILEANRLKEQMPGKAADHSDDTGQIRLITESIRRRFAELGGEAEIAQVLAA